MASALCAAPDPTAPEVNEPCILSRGHGREVPHVWSGQPCRHFTTEHTEVGERCVLCSQVLPQELLRGEGALA